MQIIDWMLFSDGKLLICRKNEKANYQYKKYLEYKTEKEYNKIDLVNNKFRRKTDDLEMELDFRHKTCKFDFGLEGNCKFDIECEWKLKKDILILTYNIDDSVKKIKIVFKELIL